MHTVFSRVLLIGASGYILTRVAHHLTMQGRNIIGCDKLAPLNTKIFYKFHLCDYNELSVNQLQECDIVFWFAGHSSVKIANSEPLRAIENNVSRLSDLFFRFGKLNLPVVYASSASVLSSIDGNYSRVANEISANSYDASKLAFDIIAPYLGPYSLGLRMATVSGWSPTMRWDLIFNAMNASASQRGIINVQNPSSFRGLLFLDDLCHYISAILDGIIDPFSRKAASQVALGSWSGSIGSLASEIAQYWGVPQEIGPTTGTYSFVLSDSELSSSFEEPTDFYVSIQKRCEIFAKQNGWSLPIQ